MYFFSASGFIANTGNFISLTLKVRLGSISCSNRQNHGAQHGADPLDPLRDYLVESPTPVLIVCVVICEWPASVCSHYVFMSPADQH